MEGIRHVYPVSHLFRRSPCTSTLSHDRAPPLVAELQEPIHVSLEVTMASDACETSADAEGSARPEEQLVHFVAYCAVAMTLPSRCKRLALNLCKMRTTPQLFAIPNFLSNNE